MVSRSAFSHTFLRLAAALLTALFVCESAAADLRLDEAQWSWPEGVPSEYGMNEALLEQASRLLRRREYGRVDSLLVLRNGVLVYEDYMRRGRRGGRQELRSAGKSVISAVFGAAMDDGLFVSEDELIFDTFGRLYSRFRNWDERKPQIRIRHLLTMTSGIRCGGFGPNGCGARVRDRRDPLKYLLDLPMDAAPGEAFNYNEADPILVRVLVAVRDGESVDEFSTARLYAPLGVSPLHESRAWTPREMARFGQLYLNRGVWRGRRILSEEWVDHSTAPHISFDGENDSGYGYFWWTTHFSRDGQTHAGYYAAGNGGQYIVVIPELELVVVTTGRNYNNLPRMRKAFEIVRSHVVPAVLSLE